MDNLSKTQIELLQELDEFGIIQKDEDSKFYPTRLAVMLSTIRSTKESFNEGTGAGYIILESNYRVYAYTTSNLQISILSLFTKLNYRLPNLVVGLITRDSIRSAFMKGISADQVIFLLGILLNSPDHSIHGTKCS